MKIKTTNSMTEMENVKQKVKEILNWFLYQDNVRKAESDDGLVKVYRVGDNLVRVDIKIQ